MAFRCWSEAEHSRRDAVTESDVAHADLTAFALALARWGVPDGSGLALLDPPPGAALDAARAVLWGLGAVEVDGRVTRRGRELADVGVHPRLARALLDGAPRVGVRRAAEVVALLAVDGPHGSGDDLSARWRAARSEPPAAWRDEVRRLRRATRSGADSVATVPDDAAAGLVVALAHPDRLARRRERSDGSAGAAEPTREYLLFGGSNWSGPLRRGE